MVHRVLFRLRDPAVFSDSVTERGSIPGLESPMPHTGIPGSSESNPEPAPAATRWLLEASGYRIGVHEKLGVIVDVLDYHPGYLVLDRKDLDVLRSALT